jgi:hypothetical protein
LRLGFSRIEIVFWTATKVNNECHNQKTNNCDNLHTGKYEFGFSVDGNCEDVEAYDNDNDDGYPRGDINISCSFPELDDDSSSTDLSAEGDGRIVPVLKTIISAFAMKYQQQRMRRGTPGIRYSSYNGGKLTFQPTANPIASST